MSLRQLQDMQVLWCHSGWYAARHDPIADAEVRSQEACLRPQQAPHTATTLS